MRNEKHPDRLEPIQGANILEEQDKDKNNFPDKQISGKNSFEKLSEIMGGMPLFSELKRRKEAGK